MYIKFTAVNENMDHNSCSKRVKSPSFSFYARRSSQEIIVFYRQRLQQRKFSICVRTQLSGVGRRRNKIGEIKSSRFLSTIFTFLPGGGEEKSKILRF